MSLAVHERVPSRHQRTDWDRLREDFDWIERLHATPQDPEWHSEGDVGVHTRMVLEALAEMPPWRALPEPERRVTWLACLLHDVAKPESTRTEEGRIRSPGHSRRGSFRARRILWEAGLVPEEREQVCRLVRHHQLPFFLVDETQSKRRTILLSQDVRLDLLGLVAEADARGRTCQDQARLVDQVELFRLLASDLGCLSRPWPFTSPHARRLFVTSPARSELAPAFDDTWGCVTLMSGLPGSGKNTWLTTHGGDQPTISLDAIRGRMGVSPAGPQGRVVAAAQEQARVFLRAHQAFSWNATNTSADHRARLVELFGRYGARTRIVSVETSAPELWRRNATRNAPLPRGVLDRLIDRWSVPGALESHALLSVKA